MITRLKFVIVVIAIILLCLPVFGQTTAEEWFFKGHVLQELGRKTEAEAAFVKAKELGYPGPMTWYNTDAPSNASKLIDAGPQQGMETGLWLIDAAEKEKRTSLSIPIDTWINLKIVPPLAAI